MRLRRVSASISVWSSAWPMCRLPVTFGGGSTIEYAGLPLDASALKYPALTQPSYSCDSASPGSQDLGRASAEGVELAVTAPFYGVRRARSSAPALQARTPAPLLPPPPPPNIPPHPFPSPPPPPPPS